MKISRRTALKVAGAGLFSSAALGGGGWFFRDALRELSNEDVETYLRGNFAYLKLEIPSKQMHAFADEYRKRHGRIARAWWHRAKGRTRQHYARQMDHLAMTFLQSTDFFLNSADESRPVYFVAFFHPYASPCWNPFAAKSGT